MRKQLKQLLLYGYICHHILNAFYYFIYFFIYLLMWIDLGMQKKQCI